MFSKDAGLFAKAKDANYLPHWILTFLIVFGVLIVGQLGTIPFLIFSLFLSTNYYTTQFILMLVVGSSLSLLLLFLWIKLMEKRKFSSIGFTRTGFIKKYFKGFLIGLLLISVVVAILWALGTITLEKRSIVPLGWSTLGSVLLILPAWMIQSSAEEAVSRGWMMNVLGARYSPAIGLFLSSLTFGLLHLFNASVSLIAILNIIEVGLFLGLFAIKEGDLWAVCGLHAAWNWAQGNIYGFEVSGNDVQIGSLVRFDATGPKWVTGGSFGPEAGIVSTLVIGVAALLVFLYIRKQAKTEDDVSI